MVLATVSAGKVIVLRPGKEGRNPFILLWMGDASLVRTSQILKVINSWRKMEPILVHHSPALDEIEGTAWSHCTQALEMLAAQLEVARPEDDSLELVLILVSGADPLTTLVAIESQHTADQAHMVTDFTGSVPFADMIDHQPVMDRLHSLTDDFFLDRH